MDKIHELIYDKCMRLAKEYAESYVATHGSKMDLNNSSYKIYNPWVDLYSNFDKGKVTEEEVKYCFNLGFVPEEYHDYSCGAGKLPKNHIKNKTSAVYRYN